MFAPTKPDTPKWCRSIRSGKSEVRTLVDVFWQLHRSNTSERQGPDFGKQYRSAIFTHSPEQENLQRNPRPT